MKLPEYFLKEPVQVFNGSGQQDQIEFPPGTLVFPFWNETLLPPHRRKEFREATSLSKKSDYVMCIIGREWVVIERKKIGRSF